MKNNEKNLYIKNFNNVKIGMYCALIYYDIQIGHHITRKVQIVNKTRGKITIKYFLKHYEFSRKTGKRLNGQGFPDIKIDILNESKLEDIKKSDKILLFYKKYFLINSVCNKIQNITKKIFDKQNNNIDDLMVYFEHIYNEIKKIDDNLSLRHGGEK